MAYTFGTAPAAYIDLGRTLSVTGNDITVAAWVYLTSATGATRRIVNQKNNGQTNPHFAISITTGEKAIFSHTPSATAAAGFAATGATTVTTDAWHHILGCQDGTEQSVWLDGVEDATNTIASGLTWAADAGVNAFISRFAAGTEQNMVGAVAEVAIWNVALTDAEKISLAKGYSPYMLTNRRSALVECRLLMRDLVAPGIFTQAITNTSGTVSEHPRIIYPWGRPGALKIAATVYTISPDDLAVAVALDVANITQNHVLGAADMAVSVALDATTITQNHVLAAADLLAAVALDTATITQNHILGPADLAVAVALDETTVDLSTILAPADLAVAVALDAVTISQVHLLAPADIAAAVALDAASISQIHVLTAADLSVAVALDATDVSSGGGAGPVPDRTFAPGARAGTIVVSARGRTIIIPSAR